MPQDKVKKSAKTGKFVSTEDARANPDTTYEQTVDRAEPEQEEDTGKQTYTLDLYQSHWRRTKTETFTVEAESEAEARKEADKIAKDKGLKKNFDFEITGPDIDSNAELKGE